MPAGACKRIALGVQRLGYALEQHVGARQRLRRMRVADYVDALEDRRLLRVAHQPEAAEELEVGRDLRQHRLAQVARLRLEIDDVDLVAGIGEDMANAAAHPSRSQRRDSHRSRTFISALDTPASFRLSSVRPSLRRSRPTTAEASASSPRAVGQGTPAHSHTETRKASPCSTSSFM